VTRLLQAVADLIKGQKTPVRQFEGLEDEKPPMPALLNARQLNPRLHPPKPSRPTTSSRRKTTPSRKKPVLAAEPVTAAVENHPVFPGFDALARPSAPSKVNGSGHVNGHEVNSHGANGRGKNGVSKMKGSTDKTTTKRRARAPRKLPLASQAA
jgi:hypothetical protein